MEIEATTKTKILGAAERLFAEKGVAASSLREITQAAEVNLAAVHYHFGSKDGLVRELVQLRFAPVNAARLRGLDELEETLGGDPIPLPDLLRVFLKPALLEFSDPDSVFPRFIGRLHLEPHPDLMGWMQEVFQPVVDRFLGAMERSLPHVPKSVLLLRTSFMVGSMIHLLSCGRQHLGVFRCCVPAAADSGMVLEQLVGYSAAGLAHV
ncbi:MAG: TetR family transcriptional regulator [Planctomycetes bacterium]|nr:TetR/AcrR family transcriptional regulator [Planctomycetota bacterium]MBL7007796.1 TetR family transcriptional regulator [Planctomycetota bacterium]